MIAYVFSSPSCEPCKTLKPVIEDLKEEFPTLQWLHVNILEDSTLLSQKYGVTKVPTIVVDTPKGVESHTGTSVAGYYKMLRNATT